MKNRIQKSISFLLIVTVLLSAVPVSFAQEPTESVINYQSFLNADHSINQGETIAIDITKHRSDADVKLLDNYNGSDGKSLYTPSTGAAEWDFSAKAGLYYMQLSYYPEPEKGITIERKISINNVVPYTEAEDVSFGLSYVNEDETFKSDIYGNHIRPTQIEKPRWLKQYVFDSMGYYSNPLIFELKDGSNSLKLEAIKSEMVIKEIRFIPVNNIKTYAQIKDEYQSKGYAYAKSQLKIIEAEKANYKSDPTLFPAADRSTPSTSPQNGDKITLNYISGNNWKYAQQGLAWDITVDEAGLYELAFKVRQDYSQGLYTNRRLFVDDEIPFLEATSISFKYSREWENEVFGNESEPYYIYLEKGSHQIKLETTLGQFGSVVKSIQDSLIEINTIYRDILIITGSSPDQYRDYKLDKLIPQTIEEMKTQADKLQKIAQAVFSYTGKKGSDFQIIDALSNQLKRFYENPDVIAKGLQLFKSNIGSLGSWINTATQQPLSIDYLVLKSKDMELPSARKGFLADLYFNFERFVSSFITDYASIGDVVPNKDKSKMLRVWIPSGRDQLQILKSMVNDDFSKKSGIPVKLELVTVSAIIPSTVAGVGPDIALTTPQAEPVNFAIRGAAQSLSDYADFEKVSNRFSPEALIPFTFENKIYALPETQHFPIMFYRKDILKQLNIPVPQTWTDIISAIVILNKNNLTFGMPTSTSINLGGGIPSFNSILLQSGGSIYSKDGKKCLLDSNQAISAFKLWTNFYLNYQLPLEFDFQNRFRTGEMPIGIADYGLYNTLMVAAPEIRGLWDFTLIPGMKKEDGSIDHSSGLSVTGSFMLSLSKNKESGWEFLKWWTSAQTQSRFGKEMESIMGPSARYATANLEAFDSLAWSPKELKALNEQRLLSKAIPEVPGGYFLSRHLNNAFRNTVIQKKDARDNLVEYTNTINLEIAGKRKEFGLK